MISTTKIRLVLCPKCRKLLPELAELPIYTCGGCGTLLQAKNRNQVKEIISSTTQENDPAQDYELEERKKSDMKESASKNKKPMESSSASALHRLMGYASLSEMINGSGATVETRPHKMKHRNGHSNKME